MAQTQHESRADRPKTVPRNAARYPTPTLPAFNFGEVLDLSATGMRIRRASKPLTIAGAIEKFIIATASSPLILRGKVVWVRKPSLFARHHEFGVQFLNVDRSLSDRLVHLAQFGFDTGDTQTESTSEAKANRRLLASMEIEDLYAILEVSDDAPADAIAAAYRQQVRRWHPDVCQDAEAPERMSRLGKAYKILRDPDLRQRYDEMRASTAGALSAAGPGSAA